MASPPRLRPSTLSDRVLDGFPRRAGVACAKQHCAFLALPVLPKTRPDRRQPLHRRGPYRPVVLWMRLSWSSHSKGPYSAIVSTRFPVPCRRTHPPPSLVSCGSERTARPATVWRGITHAVSTASAITTTRISPVLFQPGALLGFPLLRSLAPPGARAFPLGSAAPPGVDSGSPACRFSLPSCPAPRSLLVGCPPLVAEWAGRPGSIVHLQGFTFAGLPRSPTSLPRHRKAVPAVRAYFSAARGAMLPWSSLLPPHGT